MLEKIATFEVALYPILKDGGICGIYVEHSLLNFYFGFDIEKPIHVYIPTHLYICFI